MFPAVKARKPGENRRQRDRQDGRVQGGRQDADGGDTERHPSFVHG
jgi:hypothetical protein